MISKLLILPQVVKVRWNYKNKKTYESMGFKFTSYTDSFDLDALKLPENSRVKIKVLCDYCLTKGIDTLVEKPYYFYLKQREIVKKDCYAKCQPIKTKEINLIKFGVESTNQLDVVKEKKKDTNLEKYGVESSFQRLEVRKKIKQTWLDKYGVDHPVKNKKIQEKIQKTLSRNGNTKTSTQQLAIYNMLKDNNYMVELNYPFSNVSLDVAIFIEDLKIDLEYDGSYWHQDKTDYDRRRDEFLKSNGYKILRIKSRRDIPSLEEIEFAIDKLIHTGRTFTEIILADHKIIS